MAENETADDPEVDEHGLKIQKYVSMVLVVVPEKGFAETTLRYARSALYNVHVGTRSVSRADEDMAQGELQDEFQVDGRLVGETMEPYSGVLFCGGEGALDLVNDPDVLRLAREASQAGKLIGAWGHATAILAAAGVVKGKKVTGDPSVADAVRKAGGRFSTVQVQSDGPLVTALDDAAGFRFARALVEVVGIR